MVISGLINRDMQNDVTKIPGLGDLPVIGRLFRSDSFRGNRSDLLIAVTPVVIDPHLVHEPGAHRKGPRNEGTLRTQSEQERPHRLKAPHAEHCGNDTQGETHPRSNARSTVARSARATRT
jgi:Flp pilus assembly secretin CpaC